MWAAIRTFTMYETEARDELEVFCSEVYCPMLTTNSRPGKKKKPIKIEVPLYRGYILARVADHQWHQVTAAKHVIGWIRNDRGPLSVPEADIQRIKQAERMGFHDDDGINGKIKRGDLLDVLGGPLTGVRVAFIAVAGDDLVVETDFMGSKRAVIVKATDMKLAG
jgi:transcription antitermination factor NusG